MALGCCTASTDLLLSVLLYFPASLCDVLVSMFTAACRCSAAVFQQDFPLGANGELTCTADFEVNNY